MIKNPQILKLIADGINTDIDLHNKLRQMPEYRTHTVLHFFTDSLYYNAMELAREAMNDE